MIYDDERDVVYHAWRNTPAFRHGDISHTLSPHEKTSGDYVRYR